MREYFEEQSSEDNPHLNKPMFLLENLVERKGDVHGFKTANVPQMVKTYDRWRVMNPSIKQTVSAFCRKVKFSRKSKNLIEVSANLASEECSNPYHHNQHLLEVFSLAFSLGYRAYKREASNKISERNFARLLSAALLHDYGHDGETNGGEQFKLELKSVMDSRPALMAAGASPEDMSVIRAMILATDVTKDFSNPDDVSPADTLKQYEADKNHVHEELSILEDRGLVDLGLMLIDADIGIGFLDKKFLDENTQKLHEENDTPLGKLSQQFFFQNICGEKLLYSESGQELFAEQLVDIKNYVFEKDKYAPK